jgi:hypothetical protein
MNMTNDTDDKKIVVDDDWKSRVQAEKEAAAKAQARSEQQSTADTQNSDSTAKSSTAPPDDSSFTMLVSTLAFQAMTAMGRFPDPAAGHPVVRPDLAKHSIDTLGMLQEKTKGNLTRDEEMMLDHLLHELRMAFVTIRVQPTASATKPADG